MTSNAIYDEIEDSIVQALEQGAILPRTFSVTLADDEFQALLAGGLQDHRTGLPIVGVTRVFLKLAGHFVTVRSERDPGDWDLTT